MIPVSLSERFSFHCRQCGECCRHVKESVPLESMDAFRIAKYLHEKGEPIASVDDFLEQYADPVLLHDCGYTVFMLRTTGPDDACIFLKENKCTIHEVNPRACRTYPISVGPNGQGSYDCFLSMEQSKHFKGTQHTVKKWIQKRYSQQYWDFLQEDLGSVKQIASLMSQISESNRNRAIVLFLYYKYSNYDLNRSFIDQYKINNHSLIMKLSEMVAGNQS